jgi:tRNA-dihydrouridine synthase A
MNRKVSVAPMMDCTDRHERYFLRLISKNTLLYTEMVVDEAINRGDKKRLLEFNINEKTCCPSTRWIFSKAFS